MKKLLAIAYAPYGHRPVCIDAAYAILIYQPLYKSECKGIGNLRSLRQLLHNSQLIGGIDQINLHLLTWEKVFHQSAEFLLLSNCVWILPQHIRKAVFKHGRAPLSINTQSLEDSFLRG